MNEFRYDVAVIGGGVSGVCAAIASAKCGAKTILIEKSANLGGMCTGGLVNLWCGSVRHRFFRDICDMENIKRKGRVVFNPERLKTYFLDRVKEANVDLILHSTFVEPEKEGERIKSVILYAKGQKSRLCADVFIDATGDGDLCFSAGADFQLGRASDNLCEPVTLMFMVDGVDDKTAIYPTFGTNPDIEEKMSEYVADGRISSPAGHVILIEGYEVGTACVNMTNMCMVDGTNPSELTRAEIFTRSQVPQIIKFLRECVPGYENCHLLNTAEYVGVRETRHIKCDYRLTEYDIMEGRTFDDWVVKGASHSFGAHNLTGSGADESQSANIKCDKRAYTVPYSSLTVCGFENLLVVGRAICGTHFAHSSYRTMPICMGTGDGAGVAAALASKRKCSIRDVDISEVQKILNDEFVY